MRNDDIISVGYNIAGPRWWRCSSGAKGNCSAEAALCGRANPRAAIQLEISPHRDGHRFESPQLHHGLTLFAHDFNILAKPWFF